MKHTLEFFRLKQKQKIPGEKAQAKTEPNAERKRALKSYRKRRI